MVTNTGIKGTGRPNIFFLELHSKTELQRSAEQLKQLRLDLNIRCLHQLVCCDQSAAENTSQPDLRRIYTFINMKPVAAELTMLANSVSKQLVLTKRTDFKRFKGFLSIFKLSGQNINTNRSLRQRAPRLYH